jgi:hypothetical protein
MGLPHVHGYDPRENLRLQDQASTLVEGFTKNTVTAMIEGIREPAIAGGLIEEKTFQERIEALYRTTEADGVFCYTFFKATAIKPTIVEQPLEQ